MSRYWPSSPIIATRVVGSNYASSLTCIYFPQHPGIPKWEGIPFSTAPWEKMSQLELSSSLSITFETLKTWHFFSNKYKMLAALFNIVFFRNFLRLRFYWFFKNHLAHIFVVMVCSRLICYFTGVFVSEVACWGRYRPQPKYSGPSDGVTGKPDGTRRWRPGRYNNRRNYTSNLVPFSGRRYRPINGR